MRQRSATFSSSAQDCFDEEEETRVLYLKALGPVDRLLGRRRHSVELVGGVDERGHDIVVLLPVASVQYYSLWRFILKLQGISVNQGDGSVIIHQGGVEMGQGLTTQIVQIASYVLNVPMELIYVEGTTRSE